jgi:hypothetical protein
MKFARIAFPLVLIICSPAFTALYTQDFEVDSTPSWTVNNGPSDAATNFFFDYSTVGIPAAPSGAGTRGMKLQANQANGIFSGVSVSPTGQSFSGNYTVSFDWWGNFNGPFPAGGSGSTQLSTYGVGTSGSVVQWPGGTQDSVWFAATVDGNSASDWRAYSTAAPTSYADASTVYAAVGAGNRNSSHAYYASLGANTAPAAQVVLFPQQTGATLVGSAGMEWHQVLLDVVDGLASWKVDGLPIATVDLSTVVLGGGNIFFGHSDSNATSSTDPNDGALLFTLIDNVAVNAAVPEPGAIGVLVLGALITLRRNRR